MTQNLTSPKRIRPDIPKEYGVPEVEEGMVEWSWVNEQLRKSKHYWLMTLYPDGRPHTVPSWGAWVEGRLYFSGGPMTRHAKNLEHRKEMIAHLESGAEVVIVYGTAVSAEGVSAEIIAQIEKDYTEKYGAPEGAMYALVPSKILAWTDYPSTPTKFVFE